MLAISGAKEQQWYAYERARVWMRGKHSGAGNSLRFGLLNVFRCNKRANPAVGSVGNMLFPRFLSDWMEKQQRVTFLFGLAGTRKEKSETYKSSSLINALKASWWMK